MKSRRFIGIMSLWMLLCGGNLSAQYLPDTSLTYPLFLQQAQAFASQSNNQEAWVVNFWAGWNDASLYRIPRLKELHRDFQSSTFRFVNISVDKNYSIWVQRLNYFKMPGEHLFLPSETDYEFLRKAFRHNSLPATYLVYPNGSIRRVRDMDELRTEMSTVARQLQTQTPTPVVSNQPINIDDEGFGEEPASSGTNPRGQVHVVKRGDTLYNISKRYNTTVANIQQLNGLTSNVIRKGQRLRVK